MPGFNDITGRKFGRLTVTKHSHRKGAHQFWLCRCDCGNDKAVRTDHLQQGRVRSCGCLHKELASKRAATHRLSGTVMHRLWLGMHNRCRNPNEPGYKNYGGRGIDVCERWRTFENFLADMGPRPSDDHSIERIDNDRGYEKSNCRWATNKQQCNNQRRNKRITAFGRTKNLGQWSEETGIERRTISFRLKSGWPPEEAVATPVFGRGSSGRYRSQH